VYFAFCPIPKPNWLDRSAEMTTTQKPKNIASHKHHPLPFPRRFFAKSQGKKNDPNSPDFEDFIYLFFSITRFL
jgi:hypothetical protein